MGIQILALPTSSRRRITFACEWPSEGIDFTRVEIDAGPVLDAAAKAEVLWEA